MQAISFLSLVYTYKVLVRTLSIDGNHLGDLDVDGRVKLK
jgi:hypothetical protein